MMVCCTAMAALVSLILWLPRRLYGASDPMAWRPGTIMANGFSWRNRGASFHHAARGLLCVLRSEHNTWVHLGAAALVVMLATSVGLSAQDWRWLVLTIGLVWVAEVINTAVERACDAITLEHHPLIGQAKDIAAGAVLLTALMAVVMGVSLFLPYLWLPLSDICGAN